MPPPSLAQLSLRGRALKLLSGREHARQALERKLAPHAESPDQLTALLDDLAARGFLNDDRAAESLLHRRAPKLGNALLKRELLVGGLSSETAKNALQKLNQSDAGSELERAALVRQKRFGPEWPSDPAAKAKQMRFLASRGFSAEVVARVLKPPT